MVEYIFLYHCETRQMPEIMKQEALQLEPVLGSYEACKFSHTFPMEKLFNYNSLKLPSECVCSKNMRQYIISTHNFVAKAMLMLNCSPQGAVKGTINLL